MNLKILPLALACFALMAEIALANQHPQTWTKVSGESASSTADNHWQVFAVQAPGAPVLGVRLLTTNTALLYWPASATGFHLLVTTNMGKSTWTAPVGVVSDDGTNHCVLVTPSPGNFFYRLKKSE